jgi:hypothetical protein
MHANYKLNFSCVLCSPQYLEWDFANEAQVNSFIAGYWDLQTLTSARRRRQLLHKLWQSPTTATVTVTSSEVHSVVPNLPVATTAVTAAAADTTVQQ